MQKRSQNSQVDWRNARYNLRRSLLLGIGLGLGLALVFLAGFVFRDLISPSPIAFASAGGSYPLLNEVQSLIDQHYLRSQPDFNQRQYAAIRGMLAALGDRYTFFIDPPVAASESDVLAGTYGGIGVQIQRNEAGEIALYPFVDSPAAEHGIENGDLLRGLNGAPLDPALSQDAIDQLLRGEVKADSGVELTVFKPALGQELTTFILFDVINVPSVVWRVLAEDERIGYVQVLRFTARTPEELNGAFADLRSSEIAALVLDLRNNTGGLLHESIDVADEFIDSGVIVYERDNEHEETFNAEAGGGWGDLPLVVLVNNMTASGAELVAGAIRDSGRGILIGQITYGKGTVQQIFSLSDQSSLHITSAEWFTPSRQPLDSIGLTPDVPMIPDPNGRDVELGEAIRRLQEDL